jgi:hypothetical protein
MKSIVWFLVPAGFAVFAGCDDVCKDHAPWYGCSVMSSCCPPDDQKPCSYEATRNGTTREFVCKTRDDCDSAADQVARYCD